MNDYYEYRISQHFVAAIVNGDHSGLDDDEEQKLNDFYGALPTDCGTWEFEDEASFMRCDILDLHADCVKAKLHFHNSNIGVAL